MNAFRDLFRSMNDAGISYLIVGGVAVNLHGHRRFTGDIDILLALDEDNVQKMTALMHKLNYIERLPIELQALTDPDTVHRLLEEKGMTAYTFLSNNRERIDVDVLAAKSLHFSDYLKRCVMIDLEDGVRAPVISIADLIDLKKESNRSKDMEDIKMLLELKGL